MTFLENMKFDSVNKAFKHIEEEYNVKSIKYNDIGLWTYLRISIMFKYFQKLIEYPESVHSVSSLRTKKKSNFIRRLYSALSNSALELLFVEQPIVLMTDMLDTRNIDGQLSDALCYGISQKYNSLVPIITSIDNKKNSYTKSIDSDFFGVLISVLMRFTRVDIRKIEGISEYKSIMECLELPEEYLLDTVRYIIAAKKVFRLYFRQKKVKALIVRCYYDYGKMAAIEAAKELGIVTIEMQHGLIQRSHLAYYSYTSISRHALPEYLFSFGEKYAEQISPNIYPNSSIRVVGSYYLDYLRSNREKYKELFMKRHPESLGKKVITFAAQKINTELDKEVFFELSELAKLHPDLYVIFVPRFYEDWMKKDEYNNFIVETELDVYCCMINSFSVSTLYSTCLLEGLSLGIPGIVIDKGMTESKEIYEMAGGDEKTYISKVHKISDIYYELGKFENLEESDIRDMSFGFYALGHIDLLNLALDEIIG